MNYYIKKAKDKINLILSKNKSEENTSQNNLYIYLDRYKKSFNDNGYEISIYDNNVSIKGNGLDIIGSAINTFWTAEDVLCKGDYDFYSNDQYVMIDIGLNIGLTTLSMARKNNITKIYGYEPFIPTFKQAQLNLERNPQLSTKVEIFNFGLGGENKNLDINYNPELPGAMSSVRNKFEKSKIVETIEIKKASEVLYEILKNKTTPIFLKMDCEGAEGEILENLSKECLLKEIDLIIMEWHFKYPVEIIMILENNGFTSFNNDIIKNELGFIRAVNNRF
jgi:FkbM family methyltransferase